MPRCLCGHLADEHTGDGYEKPGACEHFTLQMGGCPCEDFVRDEPGATKPGPERLRRMFPLQARKDG